MNFIMRSFSGLSEVSKVSIIVAIIGIIPAMGYMLTGSSKAPQKNNPEPVEETPTKKQPEDKTNKTIEAPTHAAKD